jgi:hypothetical protein
MNIEQIHKLHPTLVKKATIIDRPSKFTVEFEQAHSFHWKSLEPINKLTGIQNKNTMLDETIEGTGRDSKQQQDLRNQLKG